MVVNVAEQLCSHLGNDIKWRYGGLTADLADIP